ncbi:MAG: helix-turn-helix domain-containing protein [Clostridia bacterium]
MELLIRQVRESRQMSLEELSRRSGISKAFLSYLERNEKQPTIPTLVRIAKALNVKEQELYKVEW